MGLSSEGSPFEGSGFLEAIRDVSGQYNTSWCVCILNILPLWCRLLYPSVSVLAVYYAFLFTISSILPAVTSASIFTELYNFTASQVGLALGVGTLIGTTLGEMLGGTVVDRTMYIHRKRHPDAEIVPEVKLHGIWAGAALQPVSPPLI